MSAPLHKDLVNSIILFDYHLLKTSYGLKSVPGRPETNHPKIETPAEGGKRGLQTPSVKQF